MVPPRGRSPDSRGVAGDGARRPIASASARRSYRSSSSRSAISAHVFATCWRRRPTSFACAMISDRECSIEVSVESCARSRSSRSRANRRSICSIASLRTARRASVGRGDLLVEILEHLDMLATLPAEHLALPRIPSKLPVITPAYSLRPSRRRNSTGSIHESSQACTPASRRSMVSMYSSTSWNMTSRTGRTSFIRPTIWPTGANARSVRPDRTMRGVGLRGQDVLQRHPERARAVGVGPRVGPRVAKHPRRLARVAA